MPVTKSPKPKPDLDDLLGGARGAAEPPSPEEATPRPTEGEGEPPPSPLITLPPEAFDDLRPAAMMSDEPPEGWGAGEGNVRETDVVSMHSQLSPLEQARASLMEDAARARDTKPGNFGMPSEPTPILPRQGSRAADIRQALARAAAVPNATKYRSRIAIGAAWQYDGALYAAPDWVSREWAAYDDGPAVEIPNVGLVRKGEWLVVQNVLSDAGAVAYEEIRIYSNAAFTRLFMPVPGGTVPGGDHGPA